MDRVSGGKIRRIQYGVVRDLPSSVVQIGTPYKFKDKDENEIWYKISEIIENKNSFLEYGYFEYEIYISRDGTEKDQLFWKRYIKRPDAIEYKISDAEELIV